MSQAECTPVIGRGTNTARRGGALPPPDGGSTPPDALEHNTTLRGYGSKPPRNSLKGVPVTRRYAKFVPALRVAKLPGARSLFTRAAARGFRGVDPRGFFCTGLLVPLAARRREVGGLTSSRPWFILKVMTTTTNPALPAVVAALTASLSFFRGRLSSSANPRPPLSFRLRISQAGGRTLTTKPVQENER